MNSILAGILIGFGVGIGIALAQIVLVFIDEFRMKCGDWWIEIWYRFYRWRK